MKFQELKQKSEAELIKLIKDDREKLRQLNFDLTSGKVKNVREIGKNRREIARVLTLIQKNA